MNPHIDFGYPWWLSYGHLVVADALVSRRIAGGSFRFGCKRTACSAYRKVSCFGPRTSAGYGAGTGKSTLMVLEARPRTTVVALDLSGQERLRSNLKAAGLEHRAATAHGGGAVWRKRDFR
ncbi:MAG: class I SAM-dependent methyltransferase [Acidobacteriota bacterium]|nr:class I SAM-dependent methyltransferase [Acidobacteriota bacterium]